ncbi:hypothetical protein HYX06_02025 [Candidatus Woesearchaeota archaeon]|nr:hypothetical protein [Candidatus Woesearchaeota archaeon]
MSKSKFNAIEKIELQLLSTLCRYIVPFLGRKIKSGDEKKKSRLEDIANETPKISFKDMRELEKSLLGSLHNNVKTRKNTEVHSNRLFYSLVLRRQKNKEEKISNYSIAIKYEENSSEEKLKIGVRKEGKEVYSSEIISKKEIPNKVAPYKIVISYEDNYAEERLSITYKQQLKNYMKQHIADKEDMTNRVPLKWLNILPENIMGGVLGFTYLGENFMGRRADLTGWTARMVDIHESIHTPDEYETRVLTSWIMEKARNKYVK